MEIKILSKQGLSLRKLSKQTGYAVNTLRKYLNGAAFGYKERTHSRPTKLSPYEPYIRERLSSSFPDWIPATVIYREILSQGYTGKIRQLRYFMSSLKAKSVVEPVIRFETEPGEQIQIDWAHISYQGTKFYAFVALLGYSRLAFVRFMDNMQIASLLECHESLFETLGGIPKQCLYDNMKTVVIARNAYGAGKHRWHPQFNDFAKHYGFMPSLCKPYRAQTKGKVERFIRYLRGSFLIPLVGRLRQARLSLDKDTANVEVTHWLDEVANVRVHATTGERPKERFKIESKTLLALPNYPYLPIQIVEQSAASHLNKWTAEQLQHPLATYDQFCQEIQS